MPHLAALELADRIACGELSAREALRAHIDEVELSNGRIQAVVTLDVERAEAAASRADEAIVRGEVIGPFHGVPMTVKDSFETVGLRTTAGTPDLAGHVARVDAVAVGRLRKAGAIVFGKTNLPPYADDWQSSNALFGTTNNPYALDRTPGGSSGGAAAALAAGFTPMELGSDIGGSIRLPAGWCGVFGHKPTHGIVPMRGHIPGPPGMRSTADLSVAGPMARTAGDLRAMLDATAGAVDEEQIAWRLSLPEPERFAAGEVTAAVWLDDDRFGPGREVTGVLRSAVDRLTDAGLRIEEARPPCGSLDDLTRLYASLLFPIVVSGYPSSVRRRIDAQAATLAAEDDGWRARFARGASIRHRQWLAANERRHRLIARMEEFFGAHDVLLTPVAVVPALPHDHSQPPIERHIDVDGDLRPYHDLLGWAALATVCLLPATVVPAGRTGQGLPVGLQIVGGRYRDNTTIAVAGMVERILGGFAPPG